jgi:hypothetical protein
MASSSNKRSNQNKSQDPGFRLPPEQRATGSLPAERQRPRAEQRTTQARRDTKVPKRHA